MNIDPRFITADQLLDPSVDARALEIICGHRQDLWAAVRIHPKCPPALAQWLQNEMARPDFNVPQQQYSPAQLQQIQATQVTQATATKQNSNKLDADQLRGKFIPVQILNLMIIVTGAIGALSLFMPVLDLGSLGSYNYFAEDLTTSGIRYFFFFLIGPILGVAGMITKNKQHFSGAATAALIFALLTAFVSLTDISDVNDLLAGSAGIGLYVMAGASIALIVLGALQLFNLRISPKGKSSAWQSR
ncbi:MAG: hypothetical protein GX483_03355 [Actinomycetaceae bacterium]|nr:hypothetical protein [Actinomycetaceae bacterium]